MSDDVRPLLLDTCATLWLMNGDPMSRPSRSAIRHAISTGAGIYVSPISAWEIGILVAKGRLRIALSPEAWFDALMELPGMRLAPLTPAVLIASTSLPGPAPRDPADRIIAAAARAFGYALVTRDGELVPYGAGGYVEVIPC